MRRRVGERAGTFRKCVLPGRGGRVPDTGRANAPDCGQRARNAASAATAPAGTEEPPAQVTQKEEESLTKQAISRVSRILPSTEGVKHLLGTPVRMVENSYSWIAKRFEK